MKIPLFEVPVNPNIPNSLNLLKDILNYTFFLDGKETESRDFSFKLSKWGVETGNNKLIDTRKKIRLWREENWDTATPFEKVLCLDFLIDGNRFGPREEYDESEMKAMLKEVVSIAEKQVEEDSIFYTPIGRVLIKRCFLEPGDHANAIISSHYFEPRKGKYAEYVYSLLNRSERGRDLLYSGQDLWGDANLKWLQEI